MNKQQGFSVAAVIIIILVIVAGGLYVYQKSSTPTPVTDNSVTADWQTYRISKYGLQFEAPNSYEIKDFSALDFKTEPILVAPLLDIIDPAGTAGSDGSSDHRWYLKVDIFKPDSYRLLQGNESPSLDAFIRTETNSWKIIKREEVDLGDTRGVDIIMRDSKDNELKVIFALYGGLFYEFMYTPVSHPIFPKILSTFKFTK